jgi:hypothetical protein
VCFNDRRLGCSQYERAPQSNPLETMVNDTLGNTLDVYGNIRELGHSERDLSIDAELSAILGCAG